MAKNKETQASSSLMYSIIFGLVQFIETRTIVTSVRNEATVHSQYHHSCFSERSRRFGPAYLLCVDLCERGPCGGGWARLFQESRVRLQRQLQVQDIVNDMLEDLHFTDFLILRNSGHQALESAVAVVHVVLQTEKILLFHFASAALRQITQGELTAARRNLMRANRCAGLHCNKQKHKELNEKGEKQTCAGRNKRFRLKTQFGARKKRSAVLS